MEEIKGCQHVLVSGSNKGKKCGKCIAGYKYCSTHCKAKEHKQEISEYRSHMSRDFNYERHLREQEILNELKKNPRNITVYDFHKEDAFSNYEKDPHFDKNEKDLIKFVDQYLTSVLYFNPNEFSGSMFYIYEKQLVNFTLDEVGNELKLRGFHITYHDAFSSRSCNCIAVRSAFISSKK